MAWIKLSNRKEGEFKDSKDSRGRKVGKGTKNYSKVFNDSFIDEVSCTHIYAFWSTRPTNQTSS